MMLETLRSRAYIAFFTPKEQQLSSFRLLAIADAHHGRRAAEGTPFQLQRRRDLGAELCRRAIEDARDRGGFDAIVLLGDMVDDANPAARGTYMAQLRDQLATGIDASVPILAVRGNHDPSADAMNALLGARGGYQSISSADGGKCRFFVFTDQWDEHDVCTRPDEQMREFVSAALADRHLPLVVLQHNPMNPPIESSYYMMAQREQLMSDYAAAGATLCLSGHYHRGGPLTKVDGVNYLTVPAITACPHPYMLIDVHDDGRVDAQRCELIDTQSPALVDVHCHTEFAYCGVDITACDAIERGRWFGLRRLCLTEHAPQLYCLAEDFWKARHIFEPRLWREAQADRMELFRRRAAIWRNDPLVRIGLEVEIDCDGAMTLRDEDRNVADLLVGAIHWLPVDASSMDDASAANAFMKTCQSLLQAGVHVLAHPWRWFVRAKRPVPRQLYGELASMLAEHNTAAEINYHTNNPDCAFFAQCIERGVKIALGTDSHATWEMSNMSRHLRLLQASAGSSDVGHLLFDPS
jgi:histidinol phosphatase-like PHP family hydrolase/predicted phosphodiesterase